MSSLAPTQRERGPATRRLLSWLVMSWAVFWTFNALRGLRFPHPFAKGFWLYHYGYGFVKRGLPGTAVEPWIRGKTAAEVDVLLDAIGLGLYITSAYVTLGWVRRVLGREEPTSAWWSVAAGVTVFVLSPFVVSAANLCGYFDHLLVIGTVAAVALVGRRRFAWAGLVAVACVLTHEIFFLFGLPVVRPRNLARHGILPAVRHGLRERGESASRDRRSEADRGSRGGGHLPDHDRAAVPGRVRVVGSSARSRTRAALRSGRVGRGGAGTAGDRGDRRRLGPIHDVEPLPRLRGAPGDPVRAGARGTARLPRGISALALGASTWAIHASVASEIPLTAPLAGVDRAFVLYRPDPYACGRPLFPNSDFSEGTLDRWQVEGRAFQGQPLAGDTPASRGSPAHPAGNWVGSYEAPPTRAPGGSSGGDAGSTVASRPEGDAYTGKLRSRPFRVDGDRILFRVSGGWEARHVFVRLLVDGEEVERDTGRNQERFVTRAWDVARHRGREAVIEIVDDASGDWGHINAEGFCYERQGR